jgi:hypothetical protein
MSRHPIILLHERESEHFHLLVPKTATQGETSAADEPETEEEDEGAQPSH